MSTLSATEVRVLSRLIERALAKPAEDREAWLAALPEPQQALVPRIRERLAQLEQPDPEAPPPAPEPMFKPVVRAIEVLGPYRLLQRLGHDDAPDPALPQLWRAERSDGGARRPLVLRLQAEVPPDGAPRERERQEVVMLPQHPRIVRLLDVGADERGRRWRVMPYVEGVGLAEHAERRALPAAQRAQLMLQVCELVEMAHAEQVALGALKPSGLRVDDDGQVQLLDWGDGRALRADTLAADVQALGAVLLSLRGGGRGGGMADADLAAIQARAQDADPGQRYPSVQALADELRLVQTFRPVPGAHAGAWHRAQLFARRRRGALAAGALGVLLLAFVTQQGLRYLAQGQSQTERGQQVQAFLQENLPEAAPSGAGSAPEGAVDIAQDAPRLQRALERARLGFPGQPVLRGQVLIEVAVRFRALGQPEQAQAVLREAVTLLQGTARAGEPALHLARAQLALQLLRDQAPDAAAQARALVAPVATTCSGAACAQALEVARQVQALLAAAPT